MGLAEICFLIIFVFQLFLFSIWKTNTWENVLVKLYFVFSSMFMLGIFLQETKFVTINF